MVGSGSGVAAASARRAAQAGHVRHWMALLVRQQTATLTTTSHRFHSHARPAQHRFGHATPQAFFDTMLRFSTTTTSPCETPACAP